MDSEGRRTAGVVVDARLGEHGVVLNLRLAQRRAVVGDDDELGLAGAERLRWSCTRAGTCGPDSRRGRGGASGQRRVRGESRRERAGGFGRSCPARRSGAHLMTIWSLELSPSALGRLLLGLDGFDGSAHGLTVASLLKRVKRRCVSKCHSSGPLRKVLREERGERARGTSSFSRVDAPVAAEQYDEPPRAGPVEHPRVSHQMFFRLSAPPERAASFPRLRRARHRAGVVSAADPRRARRRRTSDGGTGSGARASRGFAGRLGRRGNVV